MFSEKSCLDLFEEEEVDGDFLLVVGVPLQQPELENA